MSETALTPRVPFALAMLCLEDDCQQLFPAGRPTCPACGSEQIRPLAKFLEAKP